MNCLVFDGFGGMCVWLSMWAPSLCNMSVLSRSMHVHVHVHCIYHSGIVILGGGYVGCWHFTRV